MTDEEEFLFCGHLCLAASTLGMRIAQMKHPDGAYSYIWSDGNLKFSGLKNFNRRAALVSACEILQEYFSIPWQKS